MVVCGGKEEKGKRSLWANFFQYKYSARISNLARKGYVFFNQGLAKQSRVLSSTDIYKVTLKQKIFKTIHIFQQYWKPFTSFSYDWLVVVLLAM